MQTLLPERERMPRQGQVTNLPQLRSPCRFESHIGPCPTPASCC